VAHVCWTPTCASRPRTSWSIGYCRKQRGPPYGRTKLSRPVVVRPGTLRADILVGRRHLFSLAPGHRTSSLRAALLRFLRRAQFLLDQYCDSCYEIPRRTLRCLPRTQGHVHSENCIIWRASCHFLRRATTFPRPAHPLWPTFLSVLHKFPLCLRAFYVRCSRTHPHFWERTASVCIIHLCSVCARLPHQLFSLCVFLAYFSLLLLCAPLTICLEGY
jgi:hypothetical protein